MSFSNYKRLDKKDIEKLSNRDDVFLPKFNYRFEGVNINQSSALTLQKLYEEKKVMMKLHLKYN